jgi:hypothetical protein
VGAGGCGGGKTHHLMTGMKERDREKEREEDFPLDPTS